jgi:hypothetical protein
VLKETFQKICISLGFERKVSRERVREMDRKLTMPTDTILCLYHRDYAELVNRA